MMIEASPGAVCYSTRDKREGLKLFKKSPSSPMNDTIMNCSKSDYQILLEIADYWEATDLPLHHPMFHEFRIPLSSSGDGGLFALDFGSNGTNRLCPLIGVRR
jgi:hypothetical protein